MAAPGTGPAMVYQPLGSAALGHGSDDEDNERRWMVKSDLITVLRILVTLLAFADIVTWLSLGLASGTLVVAFIALFLVVGWNLTLVLPRSSFTRSLPAVVCQIGDCVCGFGGDHNQDDRPRKPKSRKQRRAKLIFIALVDLALGLIIVIFMCESTDGREAERDVCVTIANEFAVKAIGWIHVSYWYKRMNNRSCLLPLNLVIG